MQHPGTQLVFGGIRGLCVKGGIGGRVHGFWGEVQAKTPGHYEVPYRSYGQNTQKMA